MPRWALFVGLAVLVVYGLFVAVLALVGRRSDARAVAGFVPDCIVLFRRLLGDSRMPRRYRVIVVALLGYLLLPFDVVPEHWPGPRSSLSVIVKLAGGATKA